jgi:hypothetical protein
MLVVVLNTSHKLAVHYIVFELGKLQDIIETAISKSSGETAYL